MRSYVGGRLVTLSSQNRSGLPSLSRQNGCASYGSRQSRPRNFDRGRDPFGEFASLPSASCLLKGVRHKGRGTPS